VTLQGWAEILLAVGLALTLAWPLGGHIARVWTGEPTWLDPVLGPIERGIWRLTRIDPDHRQNWVEYAVAMLAFNAVGFVLIYGLLRLQGRLPLNPEAAAGMSPDLAFNTALAFITNTDWQAYVGERAASHLTQMAGLTTQNFASAGSGMAVASAFARSFASRGRATIGNFWSDLVRNTVHILLPLSVLVAIALAVTGVPQTLQAHIQAHTLEGATQTIALGPVASQEAIKMIGTNGGGFYNANSAHPYENPTAVSNMIQMVAMVVVGFGCGVAFGRVTRSPGDARILVLVMALMVMAAAGGVYAAETQATPALVAAHVVPSPNMEGKEVRFGAPGSAAFVAMTTGSSTGAVNSMHESLTPAGGGIALFLILLGEHLPGGAGSGLVGMLVIAVLAIFLAGQLVGRTPEYLGKKIETREVKLAMLASLILSTLVLGFSSLSASLPAALGAVSAPSAHGLTELFYNYASVAANNGSSFDGLRANTPYWNTTLGFAMAFGRFGVTLPALAIAGSLAAKPKLAPTMGTFPTDSPLFAGLVAAVVLILTGLQYFPALALGPMNEHFQMMRAAAEAGRR
jgi:K+-transporting ATPase ATPase A chain